MGRIGKSSYVNHNKYDESKTGYTKLMSLLSLLNGVLQ